MAIRVQHRRGTGAEHAAFVGAAGELTWVTDQKRWVGHDGATIGGIPVARLDEVSSEVLRTIGNADFLFQITDRMVVPNAAFTAPRTGTLPLASAVGAGRTITFFDALPALNGTNVLSVVRSGSDTISGATSLTLSTPGARWDFVSDGVSKWTVVMHAASRVAFKPAGAIAANTVQAALEELDTEKAALVSPVLTGTPTAPTASPGTVTTQLATAAFVSEAVSAAMLALGGRISLVSGVPVTGSDDAGATALYLVPFNGNVTQIYDGTRFVARTFTEQTLTLTTGNHLSGSTYDIFDFVDAGSVLIGAGPAWASSSSRGTGAATTEVETYLGRLVNKNAITLRNGATTYSIPARQATLRASFTCVANGQTEDSRTRRYVSNVHNALPRLMYRTETTASWTYSIAAYVIANGGNGANGLFYTHAVAGRMVKAEVIDLVANSTGTARQVFCGIGVNQFTADDSLLNTGMNVGSSGVFGHARYEGCPGIGKNAIYWLQKGANVDTQTWVAVSGDINTGIMGWTLN